ncbi:MAG: hypothetical protein JWQ98_1738 [Chlorobi bacterium]|nr:hypothetical protein [Chlorobiota bacterium]
MIHIRFEGSSYDLSELNAGVAAGMSDDEIRDCVARFLETGTKNLELYVIDRRPAGDIIIRPEAVYG